MSGINPRDLVLIDFIPALAAEVVIFGEHKAWVQISREGKAFVKDQCHAVVAMTGGVEDLSDKSDAREKLAAVFEFQDEVIVLFDLHVGIGFCFEIIGERDDEVRLTFGQDQLCPMVLQFLRETGMIGMEVCDEQVFDLVDGDAFAF